MLKFATVTAVTLALAPMAFAETQYPLTLTSCGHEITIERAPEKVVSVGQSTTEILYLLGLGDKVVGTALWFNPVLPEFAEINAKVERLSDNAPSFESVVGKEPGLVVTAYEWMIGAQGVVGTREMFDDAGIPSWVMPSDCVGKDNTQSLDGARTQMFDPELVYQGIAELAQIFDVEARGADLIADLRAREAAAVEKAKSLDLPDTVTGVFWYSSADLEIDPYVAGAYGVPGWMMSSLGSGTSSILPRNGRRWVGRPSPPRTRHSWFWPKWHGAVFRPTTLRSSVNSWPRTRLPRNWTRCGTAV